MLRLVDFLLLLACISSTSTTLDKYSAASPAQIKFAEENKYDTTGPGAEEPETAYNTFSNLEDALLSYLDDPDTKLPEQEKVKALTRLYRKGYTFLGGKQDINNEYTNPELANDVLGPKNLVYEEYPNRGSAEIPKMAVPFVSDAFEIPSTEYEKSYENDYTAKSKVSISYNDGFNPKSRYTVYHSRYPAKVDSRHKLNRIHIVKANPVNLAHYSRETFEPSSQYSYAHAVRGQDTTHYRASPSQDQILDASNVRNRAILGYYTYVDAEGNRRSLQYRSPNKDGFRRNMKNYFDIRE